MTPVRDFNNLYFFAKVVDCGSYTAAAKALGLQTSKLSRRIAALETELGVRLINRTTRRLSLTEAGKTFHRHCLALLDEAQAAKDAMSQILASPQGLVRISCPTGLLQAGVADILVRFVAKYPRVRIALDATNRRVDVVEEGLDPPRGGQNAPRGGSRPGKAPAGPRRDDPGRQSRIHCRARRATDARRY